MSNTAYKGERLSFFKIFSEKGYRLAVPLIQRDYAQGRTTKDTNEVRAEFLDALYKYLEENIPNRDLDFVYGTLETDDGLTTFIPLDGQQRLTTLFLLHWFLYRISDDDALKSKFLEKLMRDDKSMFAYETRTSSTDFCNALLSSKIDMENLIEIEDEKHKKHPSLSATIMNEAWFYRIWKNDPTIQSMLTMLESIYGKFKGKKEFFARLLDEKNPIVTFIFMDLKEYKLSDDLYIKMNSRGKPLTKFENFKAKFEQYIKGFDGETSGKYKLVFRDGTIKKVTLAEYFSYNIDTKWTNLFWQYCKDNKPENLDRYIENFIRVVITGHYLSKVVLAPGQNTDDTIKLLTSYKKEYHSLSFSNYENTEALSLEAVENLVNLLDALCNDGQKIKQYVSDDYRFYCDEVPMFKEVIENKMTMSSRIKFYAYAEYLIRYKSDAESMLGINEWMRVISNLSHPENTAFNTPRNLVSAIQGVAKMLDDADHIIAFLHNSAIEGFSDQQEKEEKIKSFLVDKSDWKDAVEKTEQHSYFNGQIAFILYFAGVYNFFENNGNLDWDEGTNNSMLVEFTRYAKIASDVFAVDGNGNRINDPDFIFERVVLSFGDYLLQKGESEYWNLLSTDRAELKRDYSWKRLLRIGGNEDGDDHMDRVGIVKSAFESIDPAKEIVAALNELINSHTESKWRNALIGNHILIVHCNQGYTSFNNDDVMLLKESLISHTHWELYTLDLFKSFEDFNAFYGLGVKPYYAWSKRRDEMPCIQILDFAYRKVKYILTIESVCKDFELQHYRVEFGFNTANKSADEYPEEIRELVESFDFTPSGNADSNKFVWKKSASKKNVYDKVYALYQALTDLKKNK